MKNTILLATVCVALGFSAAWLIKPSTPETNPQPDTTTPPSISQSDKKSSSQASQEKRHRNSEAKSTSPNDAENLENQPSEEVKAHQSAQQKMMRNHLKKKFDMRIDSMIAELGLDADQEKALRDYFDKQLDVLSSADPQKMMTDPDGMAELAAAMRGDGLTDAMSEHLTDEQKEGLEAMQLRKKKNKIDGIAMKDLSKIQQSLDLTDDQRDEVYNILLEDAETKLENESDTNVVMNGMMSSMGIDMDMGDMDMANMMKLDPTQQDGPIDQKTIIAQMKEERARKIEAKVERMAPALNETQLRQYRNHLENKGGMFNMMIQGMETQGENQ